MGCEVNSDAGSGLIQFKINNKSTITSVVMAEGTPMFRASSKLALTDAGSATPDSVSRL
jgi:hypothetical protein